MVKQVVVLGGGYAGTKIAVELDASPAVAVTLVDRREGQVHKIGALRAAVNPKWQDAVVVPRTKTLKRGKFVQGQVHSVSESAVTMADGTEIKFDYLVAATGAQNMSPGEPSSEAVSIADMKKSLAEVSDAVKASNDIVLVGGGVVGVEMAGEIKHAYPQKNVTIVHSHKEFVNTAQPPLPASAQTQIKKALDAAGVKYVMGQRAKVERKAFQGKAFLSGSRTVELADGSTLPADLVINCSGTVINSSFFPPAWRNDKGQLKVGPTLQVAGLPNVFAAGDVADLSESKMAYLAVSKHAPVVVKNILALAKGSGAKPKQYKAPSSAVMLIPVGPKRGAMVTPLGTFGNFLTSMVKGKGLFLDLANKPNGVKRVAPSNNL